MLSICGVVLAHRTAWVSGWGYWVMRLLTDGTTTPSFAFFTQYTTTPHSQSAVLEGLKVEARARKKGKTGPLELYGGAPGGEGEDEEEQKKKKKGGGTGVLPIGFGTGGFWVGSFGWLVGWFDGGYRLGYHSTRALTLVLYHLPTTHPAPAGEVSWSTQSQCPWMETLSGSLNVGAQGTLSGGACVLSVVDRVVYIRGCLHRWMRTYMGAATSKRNAPQAENQQRTPPAGIVGEFATAIVPLRRRRSSGQPAGGETPQQPPPAGVGRGAWYYEVEAVSAEGSVQV